MPLFKYVPPERVDVLVNRLIRFSPLSALNDPFESVPDSSFLNAAKPGLVNEVLAGVAIAEICEDVRRGRPTRLKLGNQRERIEKHYQDATVRTRGKFIKEVRSGIALHYRVLSFSRVDPLTATALLLWGHYTSSHKGMVLEFDASDPWIVSHEFGKSAGCDSGPVTYSPTRVQSQMEIKDRDVYFIKAGSWLYEDEFRLVRDSREVPMEIGTVDALASWAPTMLRSVTLGVDASPDTESAVRAALSHKDFAHVALRQATLHVDEYRLEAAMLRAGA